MREDKLCQISLLGVGSIPRYIYRFVKTFRQLKIGLQDFWILESLF